jgi:hypothetical protein
MAGDERLGVFFEEAKELHTSSAEDEDFKGLLHVHVGSVNCVVILEIAGNRKFFGLRY